MIALAVFRTATRMLSMVTTQSRVVATMQVLVYESLSAYDDYVLDITCVALMSALCKLTTLCHAKVPVWLLFNM